MNQHLATPGSQWGDATFADDWSFRDSTLSPLGVRQAKQLAERLGSLDNENESVGEDSSLAQAWRNVGLIVVSPLVRTLQTYELGVRPSLDRHVPVVAQPLAAERVYLSSDIGTPLSDLEKRYPQVEFLRDSITNSNSISEEWWWSPDKSISKPHAEWRPHGQGQTYVCTGEPLQDFEARMKALAKWIVSQKEETVALVSHQGVLESLVQGAPVFENVEVRVVGVDDVKRV